jgi:phage shock protein C
MYHYYRRGLYRASDGMLFGVCKGFADYFDLSVFWIRMIVLGCVIFSGFFPGVFCYLLAAMVMKGESRYTY